MINYSIAGTTRTLTYGSTAPPALGSGEIIAVSFWWERTDSYFSSTMRHYHVPPEGSGYIPLSVHVGSVGTGHDIGLQYASAMWTQHQWDWTTGAPAGSTGKHHFCIVLTFGDGSNNAEASLYVDGVSKTWDTSPTTTATPWSTTYNPALSYGGNYTRTGYFGELAVWRDLASAFGQSDIDALYNGGDIVHGAPFRVAPEKLANYWPAGAGQDGANVPTSGRGVIDLVGGDDGFVGTASSDVAFAAYDVIRAVSPRRVYVPAAAAPPTDVIVSALHRIDRGIVGQTAAEMAGVLEA